MATIRITKRAVDALKPAARNAFLWDTDIRGFGLKVTPAGAKSYLYQYRLGGRASPTKRWTIGKHGTLTPDQARDIAEALAFKVAQGIDPIVEKREAQEGKEASARRKAELAFSAVAQQFLDSSYVADKWKASAHNLESALRLHVTPKLTDSPLPDLTQDDMVRVFEAIPTNRRALRRTVFIILSRLFKWSIARNLISRSPLEGFEVPPPVESRDRHLDDQEIALAWRGAGDLTYPFGPFFRLLIGTGQRREEVAGIDWRELARAERRWTLPGSRTKNGAPNIIHLSSIVIAELDQIARSEKWPKRGLVFTTTGKTAISGYARAKSRLDAAMLKCARADAKEVGDDVETVELVPWRMHDIRRTVATGLQRLGVRFEVTEAVLNNASGRSRSGVAAVYQRHDWATEKREALDAWARHIQAILYPPETTNVVPMARRK